MGILLKYNTGKYMSRLVKFVLCSNFPNSKHMRSILQNNNQLQEGATCRLKVSAPNVLLLRAPNFETREKWCTAISTLCQENNQQLYPEWGNGVCNSPP